jgi:uncharacterized protein YjbJ (UPF0337 family)
VDQSSFSFRRAAKRCGAETSAWRELEPRNREDAEMNWDQVEGNWKQFKGKIQQQWGKLTNDDLDKVNGKRAQLVGKLQERYGYARDKAETEVESFCNTCH